jgi:hypothetical protein
MASVASQILAFLANRSSIEELEDWSASWMVDVYRSGTLGDQAVARLLRAALNAYDEDMNEDGLRRELETAVLPFVQPRVARSSTTSPRREVLRVEAMIRSYPQSASIADYHELRTA